MNTLTLHSPKRAAAQLGIGTLVIAIAILVVATPLFSYAAGPSITVKPGQSQYVLGNTLTFSGTVTPANATSAVALTIANPSGATVGVATVAVTGGAFSYSQLSGGSSNWVNGTYSVTAKFSDAFGTVYSASASFLMGPSTTTTPSTTSTSNLTTVIIKNYTTTKITSIFYNTTITKLTTVAVTTQLGGTTVTQQTTVPGTTVVTTVVQPGTTLTQATTVTAATTLSQFTTINSATTITQTTGDTGLYVGVLGVVIAIIAGAVAVR